MATNQQGQRAQNDPNAPQNQADNNKDSNLSSDVAQSAGSIEGDTSIRSGLSGQASQPHAVGRSIESIEDQTNTPINSGTGMTSASDKGGERQGDKSGRGHSRDEGAASQMP